MAVPTGSRYSALIEFGLKTHIWYGFGGLCFHNDTISGGILKSCGILKPIRSFVCVLVRLSECCGVLGGSKGVE